MTKSFEHKNGTLFDDIAVEGALSQIWDISDPGIRLDTAKELKRRLDEDIETMSTELAEQGRAMVDNFELERGYPMEATSEG